MVDPTLEVTHVKGQLLVRRQTGPPIRGQGDVPRHEQAQEIQLEQVEEAWEVPQQQTEARLEIRVGEHLR